MICSMPEDYHVEGQVNHEFSADGQLVPIKKVGKTPPPAKSGVVLGRLIGMLANKGILSAEEVGRLFSEEP